MEEGGRGSNDDAVLAKDVDGLATEGDGVVDIVLPDVASRDETKGEDDLGVFDGVGDSLKLTGLTVQVDVQTSDGEVLHDVHVGLETAEVGSEDDLGGNSGELGVCLLELSGVGSSGIENQDGFVDLDPLDASILELSEELLVDGDEFVEEGDGLEAGLCATAVLSKEEEGKGTEDDGAGGDTDFLGFLVFIKGLVEVELEVRRVRELGDDVVVVGVEPTIPNRSASDSRSMPE